MMFKKKILWYILSYFICLGCQDKNTSPLNPKVEKFPKQGIISDSIWVKNEEYAYGDIRRYGFSNKALSQIQLDSIVELAGKGIEIVFPKGTYPINFTIENKENLSMHFDGSTITGKLSFLNAEQIKITGNLEILDILFLKNSKNIFFEDVRLRTDILKNKNKKANRGVNIYSGCKNVTFDNLHILNSGGDDDFFAYAHAALMIHGFNDTPEKIGIKNVLIENSNRTGAYISGRDHVIQKIEVVNYGLTNSTINSKPVEKASIGEEKIYSGIWMNFTENNTIDTLMVRNQGTKGKYSVIFDESMGTVPNIVQAISLSDTNTYKTDYNSNIIVLNEF